MNSKDQLSNKIIREFNNYENYVEVFVLDGNGDAFEVYKGDLHRLSGSSFNHILREPGCFYFFNVSSAQKVIKHDQSYFSNSNRSVVRKELVWLTDPLPPLVKETTAYGIYVSWQPVNYCGVNPPATASDSIIYTIEVCEGVDWKDSKMSSYMSDITASKYIPICSRANLSAAKITDLLPATWYHIKLVIDYMGIKVVSESISVHTTKSTPAIPAVPRAYIVPVNNAFDLSEDAPIKKKVLISWTASRSNGSDVIKYQVQLRRIDPTRHIIPYVSPVRDSLRHNEINEFLGLTENRESNQWVRSPNKSLLQIRNSVVSREQMSSASRLEGGTRSQLRIKTSPNATVKNMMNSFYEDMKRDSIASPSLVRGGEVKDWSVVYPSKSNALHPESHPEQPSRVLTWETIFMNITRSVTIPAPNRGETEWYIRIRALNKLGWSNFSEALKMNSQTHPSLFEPQLLVDEVDISQELLGDQELSFMDPIKNGPPPQPLVLEPINLEPKKSSQTKKSSHKSKGHGGSTDAADDSKDPLLPPTQPQPRRSITNAEKDQIFQATVDALTNSIEKIEQSSQFNVDLGPPSLYATHSNASDDNSNSYNPTMRRSFIVDDDNVSPFNHQERFRQLEKSKQFSTRKISTTSFTPSLVPSDNDNDSLQIIAKNNHIRHSLPPLH